MGWVEEIGPTDNSETHTHTQKERERERKRDGQTKNKTRFAQQGVTCSGIGVNVFFTASMLYGRVHC